MFGRTAAVAMKLPVTCRTCDSTDTDNLMELATPSKKYPDKLLSDILAELTDINVNKAAITTSNRRNAILTLLITFRWMSLLDRKCHKPCASLAPRN